LLSVTSLHGRKTVLEGLWWWLGTLVRAVLCIFLGITCFLFHLHRSFLLAPQETCTRARRGFTAREAMALFEEDQLKRAIAELKATTRVTMETVGVRQRSQSSRPQQGSLWKPLACANGVRQRIFSYLID